MWVEHDRETAQIDVVSRKSDVESGNPWIDKERYIPKKMRDPEKV